MGGNGNGTYEAEVERDDHESVVEVRERFTEETVGFASVAAATMTESTPTPAIAFLRSRCSRHS